MKIIPLKTLVLLLSYFFISSSVIQAQHFIVTTASDSGPGSFRQAITDANNRPGLDSISFNIPGPDFTIDIDSGLTQILDDVIIDATTQPGFTNEPIIIINGKGWPGYGLVIGGAVKEKLTIRGLQISNFWKTGALTGGRYRSVVDLQANVLTFEKNVLKDIGSPAINYGGYPMYLYSSHGGKIANNSLGASLTSTNPADVIYAHLGFYVQANGTTIENNQIGYFTGDSTNAFMGDLSSAMYILSSSNFASPSQPMVVRNNKIGLDGQMSIKKAYGLTYFVANIIYDDNFAPFHLQYHHMTDNLIQGCEFGGFCGVHLYNLVFFGPGNHVKDNLREGVTITTCNYMNVIGNLIEKNKVGVKITFVPLSGLSNRSRKVRIGDLTPGSGNRIYNNNTSIIIENGNSDNFILNNDIKNNTSPVADVVINGGVQNVLVQGNSLSGNGALGLVVSNSCQNIIVQSNTISGYSNGLEVSSSSNNNQIINNIIIGIDAPNSIGIKQHSGGSDNSYTRNTVSRFSTGIELSTGAFNGRLFQNYITASKDAISLYNGANQNKISQTSLIAPVKAINLNKGNMMIGPGNNAKDTASISIHSIAGNTLTVSGTGAINDSVEIFVSTSLGETALTYAGHTKINAAGTWSIDIPKGTAWNPSSDYYYVSTATDANGNTSELSKPHFVPGSLACECIVYNTFDAGPGTLREAIKCSNATFGKDTIKFAIPGTDTKTIYLQSALPELNDAVFIDGTSQSGTGSYSIVLNGASAGFIAGLQLWDAVSSTKPHGSKIEGLSFEKFNTAIVVSYGGLENIEIKNCKIKNGGQGIALLGAINSSISDCEISNNTSFGIYAGNITNCLIQANVVNNNSSDGIYLTNASAKSTIESNKVFSNMQHGISLTSSSKLITVKKNNIFSNNGHGVWFTGTADSCYVEENLIGADSDLNSKGNTNYGIRVEHPGHKNIFIKNNTIGFNKSGGIYIQGTDTVKVLGNYIGVSATNIPIGNIGSGIYIYFGSSKVRIGDGTAAGQNTIANNTINGILVANGGTLNNMFRRNLVYNNGVKQISLDMTGSSFWGNDSKVTPYITSRTYASGQMTLTVQAEAGDVLAEVYKAGTGLTDASQFVSSTFTNLGNGKFSFSFPWPNDTDFFTVLSTDASGSSSEIGYELARTLVVINTNDNGFGSLRHAMETANLISDTSKITFAIPGTAPHIIQPITDLPRIKYSTIIEGGNSMDIIVDGTTSASYGGITLGDPFNTPGTDKKYSEIRNLTVRKFQNGILIDGHNAKIEGVVSRNNSQIGIFGARLTDTLTILNSIIENNGDAGFTSMNQSGASVLLKGNTISSNKNGITDANSSLNRLVIEGNSILNNTTDGIGSSFAGAPMYIYNNTISGNGNNGINNSRGGVRIIKGNIIGLNSTLTAKLPNKNGITTWFGPNIIIDSNIVSGNLEHGISADRMSGIMKRNYIGTTPSFQNFGNGLNGINSTEPYGLPNVGTNSLDSANVIGFNGENGIRMFYGKVSNNYIGVSPSFTNIGNAKSGVKSSNTSEIKSNYIGYNKQHGIDANYSATITKNFIGGDSSSHSFKNEKWGIVVTGSSIINLNYIASNDSGGVNVLAFGGKLSKNIFPSSQPKAISLNGGTGNGNKQAAAFTTPVITPASVTLKGTGINGDTIEIFASTPSPEIARRYLGYAVVASGNWQFTVPKGIGYDPLQNNYYVNTATTNFNTSPLSTSSLVPVHVCPMPALNTLAASIGICKDDSVLVDAIINNVSYKWYNNGNVIATTKQAWLKKGGEFRLEVQDSFGCFSKDTIKITENVLPLTADFLMPSEAGKGDKVIVVDISFSKPDSVKWNFTGATTVVKESDRYVLSYATKGNYQVTATSYLGTCSKTVSHFIQIGDESKASPDGVVYPYSIKNVTVGPNPSNGVFVLTTELAKEETIKVDIFNSSGLLLQSRSSIGKSFTHIFNYDLSALSGGNYIIRVTSGKDIRVLRILKQ